MKKMQPALDGDGFGSHGVVTACESVFEKVLGPSQKKYDKMGVLREAMRLIDDGNASDFETDLESRFFAFCRFLREKTDACEHAHQVRTGKQAIKRIIHEFFIIHRESSTLFDIGVLINRLERETELLGDDGESLVRTLHKWREAIEKMRAADQQRLSGETWKEWKRRFELVKTRPAECP